MSYIPKYILKRMIAKDAIKNTEYGWKVEIKNVISPLSVDEIPDNVENLFKVYVDGKELDKSKISLAFENIEVTMENPKDALGVTVPVGGILELRYKGEHLSPGSHDFKLEIEPAGNMTIEFTREVSE
ncbi:MAG: hypothetical protein ACTSWN_09440 [Promethearchaeota archaeon]